MSEPAKVFEDRVTPANGASSGSTMMAAASWKSSPAQRRGGRRAIRHAELHAFQGNAARAVPALCTTPRWPFKKAVKKGPRRGASVSLGRGHAL